MTGNQRAVGGVVAAVALISAVVVRYGKQAPEPVVAAPVALVVAAVPCCMKMSWQFSGANPDLADETVTFTLRASGMVTATETREHVSGPVSTQSFAAIVPRGQFFAAGWLATMERSGGGKSEAGLPTVYGFGGVDADGNSPASTPETVPGRRRAVTP